MSERGLHENDIICGIAMSEEKLGNGEVRYSAAYPMRYEFGDEPYHTGLLNQLYIRKSYTKVFSFLKFEKQKRGEQK